MPRKQFTQRPLGDTDDILFPEKKIEALKRQILDLQKIISEKDFQINGKNTIIQQQSEKLKQLEELNNRLIIDRSNNSNNTSLADNIDLRNVRIIEECLLETKKDYILLCEGNRESLDYKIYSAIYTNALIIPYDGCTDIIKVVDTYKKYTNKIYGIIDRDGRGIHQVAELMKDGIYCLDARAIENLMFADEIFIRMMEILELKNPHENLIQLKNIANERYKEIGQNYIIPEEDILLHYPPKKILGLAISVINDKKICEYFETFLSNLNDPYIISVLEGYTPSITRKKQQLYFSER